MAISSLCVFTSSFLYVHLSLCPNYPFCKDNSHLVLGSTLMTSFQLDDLCEDLSPKKVTFYGYWRVRIPTFLFPGPIQGSCVGLSGLHFHGRWPGAVRDAREILELVCTRVCVRVLVRVCVHVRVCVRVRVSILLDFVLSIRLKLRPHFPTVAYVSESKSVSSFGSGKYLFFLWALSPLFPLSPLSSCFSVTFEYIHIVVFDCGFSHWPHIPSQFIFLLFCFFIF